MHHPLGSRIVSATPDQVGRPAPTAEAAFEALAAQLEQASELARAELVGTETEERLVVVAGAEAVEAAPPAVVTGRGWLVKHESVSGWCV
jgi:hypothetical protein